VTVRHYGIPGRSLEIDGTEKYGPAAGVGAEFERRVAAAFDQWLSRRLETVHLFHDVRGLQTTNRRTGRRLNLGTNNIDHVMLTGAGWIMADAKGIGRGRLLVEHGRGVLVTPAGTRRPQPWLDDGRAYSRAGALFDLTGLPGLMVWVLADDVDYSAFATQPPRCLQKGGYVVSLTELAAGELETAPELPPPYSPADPRAIAALQQKVHGC
jgi:hypothetical protein